MQTTTMDWDPVTHYKEIAVAERYDRERFSSLAGRVFNRLEKFNIRRAFSGVAKNARVLDLPSGTGRLAETLLESGYRLTGGDISPAMLEVAKRKLTRFGDAYQTRVMDAFKLAQNPVKEFDAALAARVLMHFPLEKQIEFLRGVAAVTKGEIVFTQSYSSPYQRFRRRIKRLLGNQASAYYPITEDELQRLLKGAGLREVRRLRPMALISEEIIVVARAA